MSRPAAGSIFLVGVVVALTLPGTDALQFSGLPLSHPLEFAAGLLCLPFLGSRVLRGHVREYLRGLPRLTRRTVVAAPWLGTALKVWLLFAGVTSGYAACFAAPVAPLPGRPCERSFEQLIASPYVTRFDPAIDFPPGQWNLGFINSLRFNFSPAVPGGIHRVRVPFTAEWRGDIDEPPGELAVVTYTGAGRVAVDGTRVVTLPPAYGDIAETSFSVPSGVHHLDVLYAFDDGYRTGQAAPPGPNPELLLRIQIPDGSRRLLLPQPPGWPSRAVMFLADAATAVALLVLFMGAYGPALRRDWAWLALWVALAGGVWATAGSDLAATAWATAGAGILVSVVLRTDARRWVVSYLGVALASVAFVLPRYASLRAVTWRPAGEDTLTYESFARTILETHSLRGGEAVFYYQPFYRYVRAAFRCVFGEGEPAVTIPALTLLGIAVIFGFALAAGRGVRARVVVVGIGILAVVFLAQPAILDQIEIGLPEWPTWIALPAAVALLFAARTRASHVVGVLLLALSAITRANQMPGIAVVLIAFVSRAWSERWWRSLAVGAIVAVAALLLPLSHNLYYGHSGALLTRASGTISQNLVLPPARAWSGLLSAGPGRDALLKQLRFLAGNSDAMSGPLEATIRLLQVAWLSAGWILFRRVSAARRILYLSPLAYLGVHVFYQVDVYYPRHIVVGYLAAALASAYLWAEWLEARGVLPPAVG